MHWSQLSFVNTKYVGTYSGAHRERQELALCNSKTNSTLFWKPNRRGKTIPSWHRIYSPISRFPWNIKQINSSWSNMGLLLNPGQSLSSSKSLKRRYQANLSVVRDYLLYIRGLLAFTSHFLDIGKTNCYCHVKTHAFDRQLGRQLDLRLEQASFILYHASCAEGPQTNNYASAQYIWWVKK